MAKKTKNNAFGTTTTDAQPIPKPEFAPETDESQYDDTPGTFAGAPPTARAEDEEPPVEDEVVEDAVDGGGDDDDDAAGVAVPADDGDDEDSGGAEASAPEFTIDLLNAAGLSETEARAQFKTPEALEEQVRSMDARFVQAGQSFQFASPASAVQPPAATVQPTQPTDTNVSPDEFDEDWDEDTRRVAVELTKRFQKQLSERDKALQQHAEVLAQVMQQTQAGQQQQYVQEFDGFVKELGDDWKPIFGSGDGYSLPVNSLAMQNRVHLDRVAAQLAAGRRAYNQPELSQKELLSRAVRVAFPEVQKQTVRREVTADVVKRQRLVTERPTHRRSKQMTGEERAIHAAETFFKKNRHVIDQEVEDLEVI